MKSFVNNLFIFIATNIIYWFINKDKNKIIKMILISSAILIAEVIIEGGIIACKPHYIQVYGIGQFLYEIICFAILINTAYCNRRKLKLNVVLDKKEKIIIVISLLVGIIAALICCISNPKYILPYNEEEEIGNLYFNADVHRGVKDITTYDSAIHEIHPLYRFANLILLLPIILLNTVFNALNINNISIMYMNAYICLIVQIIYNAISALMLYKILRSVNLKEVTSFLGSIMFIFSLPFIWLSILPETYSITLLALLFMIYFYINKNSIWIAFAILALGLNFMVALPISIIILHIFVNNIRRLSKRTKTLIFILVIFIVIASMPVIKYSYKYIITWCDKTLPFKEKIANTTKWAVPIMLGPEFININPFLVQITKASNVSLALLTVLASSAIIGYFSNFKKGILPNLCLIQLLVGFILHILVGYGINNGIIYAPLYVLAFVILISYGVENIIEHIKNEKIILYLACATITLIAIINIKWLFKLKNIIKTQDFSTLSKSNNIQAELKYENGKTEKFYMVGRSVIQVKTGKKLIGGLDSSYTYDKLNNTISGTLLNSEWFKLYVKDDKLILNVNEKEIEIKEEPFFILGMGLREKYLFVKEESKEKYKLVRYSDEQEIINNLILENIDYENYVIYAKDENKNKITIYENENGIYIHKENEEKVLDDSIKINIPTFDNYKHKKQLKILFNEVMINITKDGPKPNFIAYKNSWYRDSAIIAMVLKKTDNVNQIEDWISKINSIYDMQNGCKEPDNLGQVLFLMSLIENKNENIINDILEEAENIKTEGGYLNGITDGTYHPIYQTKWLIFGLKSLGLNYEKWKIPNVYDDYESLLWFEKEKQSKSIEDSDRWPYLFFARLHYEGTPISFEESDYPISSEYCPSKANFKEMSVINKEFTKSKLIVPHAWSAAEMFLYLIDLDEGRL